MVSQQLIQTDRCRRLLFTVITLLVGFCLLPSPAKAASVDVDRISDRVIVGEPVAFVVKIEVEDDDVGIDVSGAQYQGKPIPYEVRSQGTSSFTMIVNGKTVRSSSGSIKQYIFTLTTEQVGSLTIPSFDITVGEKKYTIDDLQFTVTERPTSDNLHFLVALNNPQPRYYPSQIIDLRCTILYRNLQGSPSVDNISLPILKDMSFEHLPDSNPNFELIINDERLAVRSNQGSQVYQGKRYNSLVFHLKFRLMRPGQFQFKNALKMLVETGRSYRRPSLFFSFDLDRERRPLFAESQPLNITVQELPQDNVPSSFNGAIGQFKIKVTPSSDTAIRVGDPVTLRIEISGRGTWEFVKAPPLEREPKITDYFIVSSEPVVGELNETKTTKSFSVRLRVKSQTVQEIPPIPFTYFNLESQEYVTLFSDPVPLHVFEAATTAKVTDFSSSQEEHESTDTPPASASATASEENNRRDIDTGTKPVLPEKPPLIETADNFPDALLRRNDAPVYSRLLFAVLPLGLIFVLFVLQLYRRRGSNDEKNATVLSRKAGNILRKELDALRPTEESLPAFCSGLGQSIQRFLENRYRCSLTLVSPEVLRDLGAQHGIDTTILEELIALLESIDQHRYSPRPISQEEAHALVQQTKEVLKKCA